MRMPLMAWLAAAVPAALIPLATAHAAGGLANLAPVTPVMQCADVKNLNVSSATDALVTLTSATLVTAGTPAPNCEVRGTIAPANTIVVRPPLRATQSSGNRSTDGPFTDGPFDGPASLVA